MKFNNLSSFKKHIRDSLPKHVSNIYIIVLKDAFERKFLIKNMFKAFCHFSPQMQLSYNSMDDNKIEHLFENMLFQQERFLVLDNIDKLNKKELNRCIDQISSLNNTKIIFAGESVDISLYEKTKKDSVCLDLKDEKPWDRKSRIMEDIIKIAKENGKILNIDSANMLIDSFGLDLSFLKNEIEKLCCFIDDSKNIDIDSIEKLKSSSIEKNFWQIAEALIWDQKITKDVKFKDLSDWLYLLVAIRYNIYLGIEIAESIEFGNKYFNPKLGKVKMDKYLLVCKNNNKQYFISKLLKIFDLEYASKNQYIKLNTLWNLLTVKIFS